MKTSRIKEFKNFCLAAAILVAGASLASCSSSDDIAENNQQPVENPTAPKVYTMTIQASKGDGATTRGLSLDKTVTPHKLNATWNAGEEVLVYQSGSKIGTLTATASTDASTTLSGTLDPSLDPNQDLTFYFHRADAPSYSGQDGTLATIASTYDFCEAATVTKGNFTVNTSDNTVDVPAGISFGVNQQAIVKFTLIDKADGTTLLNAKSLVVNDGTTNYTITPASATSEIYVAIPGISDKKVTLTATDDNDTYTYEKSGVTFTNGQYYEIAVSMYKYIDGKNINTESMYVPTGQHWHITGTSNTNKITIADGAAVTLDGVNINGVDYIDYKWAGITCLGNATIILSGTNNVKGFYNNYPGIQAGPEGSTLTIDGTGSLDARNNATNEFGCSGIGSGNNGTCGNIIIQGSVTIEATGGNYAAGIGSGNGGTCGTITIKGGTVTATGGAYAAGIGSGGGGTCGTITITGGTIEATGGTYAPGIGSGDEGSCGAIAIASTVRSVTATKDKSAANSIGAGAGTSCGTVTIDDVSNATTSSTFSHFDSVVSNNGNTWTLTHKNP